MLQFKDDWFSDSIESWSRRLGPMAGKPLTFLEIGSYEGRSAVWLFENILTHPDSKLVAIDCEFKPNFWHNMGELKVANTPRLETHTGISMEIAPNLPSYAFDFVYVDGSHEPTHVLCDLICALRCLKDGCWMCADDYPYVHAAVDSFATTLKASNREFTLQMERNGYQAWIRKLNHFPHWLPGEEHKSNPFTHLGQ